MNCKSCGFFADCECNFIQGICMTCYKKKSHIIEHKKYVCEQSLENLNLKLKILENEEENKLKIYKISILKSQINIFTKNPCKFKHIIDNF
jgi:hypothetical protein